MEDTKKSDKFRSSCDMQDILIERERLEKVLKDRFRREVSIMFSDICGYTQYIDKRGDIQGRTLLVIHNRIVLPVIDQHQGKVIEIIGDGVMASFENPIAAVKAAVAIQEALLNHNMKTDVEDNIHVKIGINSGNVLVDESANYQGMTGDVANVAARIQAYAKKNQILISESAYEKIKHCQEITCWFHDRIHLKGKTDRLPVYRILWHKEETKVDIAPPVAPIAPEKKKRTETGKVIHLDIALAGSELKISALEKNLGDEESTLRHYEKVTVAMKDMNSRCSELVETLNKANRSGRLTKSLLTSVQERGQLLYDDLFTLNVKEKLRHTDAKILILSIDDQLVHIPWELLYDSQQFLCLQFDMGRVVKTHQVFPTNPNRTLISPLKMLILADPTGDLKGAYSEGIKIRDYMDQLRSYVNVNILSDHVSAEALKGKLRNYDLIHFAGHADYQRKSPDQSGWRLSDSRLTTKDIARMTGTTAMPAMIFANACQSARTDQWILKESFQNDIFGLANAFLLSGVKHYIGTFWEIIDEQSSRFALEFYKYLLSEISIGRAVRRARKQLVELYGEKSVVWASYVLYGDPSFDYMDNMPKDLPAKEDRPDHRIQERVSVRTREKVNDISQSISAKPRSRRWLVASIVVALLSTIFWGYRFYEDRKYDGMEHQALLLFQNGQFEEAETLCKTITDKKSQRPMSYVLLGNIQLARGDQNHARLYFRKALDIKSNNNSATGVALMGLGRLSSLNNQSNEALEYYRQAHQFNPENVQAIIAQAVLTERSGNFDEALGYYDKAMELSPDDPGVRAAARNLQEKVEWNSNLEKRKRIDQLVQDLLNTGSSMVGRGLADEWTSPPLTIWLMDFKTTGYGLSEGTETLVQSMTAAHLMEHSRSRIVERALMDRLLEELKIGTSQLANPSTALELGRLTAALVLISGHIHYRGAMIQATVRIIETETGLVAAVVNESFNQNDSASQIAVLLANKLADQLSTLYPLRCKIIAIDDTGIVLNIGNLHGIKSGQKFKGVDTDIIAKVVSTGNDTSRAILLEGKPHISTGAGLEIMNE